MTTAAYLCQQAAEKRIKALLIVAAERPPRTHNLAELGRIAGPYFPKAQAILARFAPLKGWASDFRYPDPDAGADMPPHSYAIRGALADIAERATLLRALTTPT